MPAYPPIVAPAAATDQSWWTSTSTVTVAATTAETSLLGAGSGSLVVPANPLVGRMLRLAIRGAYSTPALSVGNLLVKVKLAGTVLASATATALSVPRNQRSWPTTAFITFRSVWCRTVTWSNATAGNSISALNASLEVLN